MYCIISGICFHSKQLKARPGMQSPPWHAIHAIHAIHALYVACPHPSFLSLNCMIASRLSLHSLLFPLEEKKLKYMQSMQYMQYMSRLDVRSSRLVGVVSVPARRPVVLARRPVVPARRPVVPARRPVVPARRIKGPAWHEGSASNPRKPKSAK